MTSKSKGTSDDPVRQLARLLIKAAPLAERLNSPATSHEDRARLRELVGGARYSQLAVMLNQMRGWQVWEIGHAKDEATRKRLSQAAIAGVTVSKDGMTFHWSKDEPPSHDPS